MNAQELYKAGQITQAIAALNSQLRDNPTDLRQRTFLFELLCFAGDYVRAERQLHILEQEGDQAYLLGTLMYRAALNAEKTRQEMFAAKTYPKATANGSDEVLFGKLNGREFQALSDADSRIAGKLEVFAAGKYMWISYRDIAAVYIEPPKRLRDLLWIPAYVQTGPTFQAKEIGDVLLPAIYPLSWRDSDDRVRLGRVTEWREDEMGGMTPVGQKILLVDDEEIPFLDIRELRLHSSNASLTLQG